MKSCDGRIINFEKHQSSKIFPDSEKEDKGFQESIIKKKNQDYSHKNDSMSKGNNETQVTNRLCKYCETRSVEIQTDPINIIKNFSPRNGENSRDDPEEEGITRSRLVMRDREIVRKLETKEECKNFAIRVDVINKTLLRSFKRFHWQRF